MIAKPHILTLPCLQGCLLIAALFSCSGAAAHDFWLQPARYALEPGAVTPMTLQVGHGAARQRSPIAKRRILRFAAYGAHGEAIDLRDELHPGGADDDAVLRLADAGVYVLALETDARAESHLPALRFNDYLQAEGLTPAIEQRRRLRRMQADGSENYSRHAKAIVRVGTSEAAQDAVTRPLGLTLEIVPERSPYQQPRAADLPVRVLLRGEPLPGALLKLTDLDHDEQPFETHLTDADGRARFALPARGAWLLNVVWTLPQPADADTEFATMFSSLSFGFATSDASAASSRASP